MAGEAEVPHPDVETISPIPVIGQVTLNGTVPTTEQPADFGTYRTINLTGSEEKQQILPQDPQRVRAAIKVTGAGPVWVGSEAQCAAVRAGNTAGGGAQLAADGILFPIGHKETLWLVGDGAHTATVVVSQERNRT